MVSSGVTINIDVTVGSGFTVGNGVMLASIVTAV